MHEPVAASRADQRVALVLSTCDLFNRLTHTELEALARLATPIALPDRGTVFAAGSRAEHLYIIESGLVRVESQHPTAFELSLASAGDVLGWSSLVEPMVNLGTAFALSDTHALRFNAADLRQFIDSQPIAGRDIMTAVARHARYQLWALLAVTGGIPAPTSRPLT